MPYWIIKNSLFDYFNPMQNNYSCDVVIIGSGITGALVAHTLCANGVQCCVVDKRTISTGSTIASTALLQYEIDVPLSKMIAMVGRHTAVSAYKSCLQAISDIENVFATIGYDPDFERVPSVYYANNSRDLSMLKEEYAVRKKFSLPTTFLDSHELQAGYAIRARGALENKESAQIDAYKATTLLLQYNMEKNSLAIFSHTQIVQFRKTRYGYTLTTNNGHTISCRFVVIAAGFESETFLPKPVMKLTSTYALISEPLPDASIWAERALLWETKEPYLYLRVTKENRIIVGGEDEEFRDPVRRDSLLRAKVRMLERKFKKLFPHIPLVPDMAWCGTFSSTKDGLPYIGAWPGNRRMLYALGYGGNGITFSMIAAQIIANTIRGAADTRKNLFGFERSA